MVVIVFISNVCGAWIGLPSFLNGVRSAGNLGSENKKQLHTSPHRARHPTPHHPRPNAARALIQRWQLLPMEDEAHTEDDVKAAVLWRAAVAADMKIVAIKTTALELDAKLVEAKAALAAAQAAVSAAGASSDDGDDEATQHKLGIEYLEAVRGVQVIKAMQQHQATLRRKAVQQYTAAMEAHRAHIDKLPPSPPSPPRSHSAPAPDIEELAAALSLLSHDKAIEAAWEATRSRHPTSGHNMPCSCDDCGGPDSEYAHAPRPSGLVHLGQQ